MRVSNLLALCGTLAAASAVIAQPTALDTLGPGNGWNPNASDPIRGALATGGFLSYGYLFTAEASGTVTQITTALEHVSGLNRYALQIRVGDANGVGVDIGIWKTLTAGTTTNPIMSTSGPSVSGAAELVAGQTYWILAIAEDDGVARWYQREVIVSPNTYSAVSTNANQWFLTNNSHQRAIRITLEGKAQCYANCDGSTTAPVLNVDDFTCFINEFATASSLPHEQQIAHYANCDGSTTAPALNVDDFTCFINAFAQGCP